MSECPCSTARLVPPASSRLAAALPLPFPPSSACIDDDDSDGDDDGPGGEPGIPGTDRERKRQRRLLRNRVSAQQARERKKAYLGSLESRMRDAEALAAQWEVSLCCRHQRWPSLVCPAPPGELYALSRSVARLIFCSCTLDVVLHTCRPECVHWKERTSCFAAS